jgi:hypothetical protein
MNRRDFLTIGSAALLTPLAARGSDKVINARSRFAGKKVGVPERGKFYHGVYPGTPSCTGNEDDIQFSDLDSYQKTVGRNAAWVYFSNNWMTTQEFPGATAKWISGAGSTPFIRLMLRSTTTQNTLKLKYERTRCKEITGRCDPEKHNSEITCNFENKYSLDFILKDRKTKDDLIRWGINAKKFGKPLIVEWGTEMNGYWFAWNGWWSGKAEGVEKFKATYKYIHKLITEEGGADNVTWVFHVNNSDDPNIYDDENAARCIGWNKFENYYPGDFIDWLGVSVYGALEPSDDYCTPFKETMDEVYDRLAAMTPNKPIMLLEFGVTMNNKKCGTEPASDKCNEVTSGAAKWANDALSEIFTNPKYRERLRGFSWWNECWENDDGRDPKKNTNMRVQTVPCLKEVFQKKFTENKDKIVDKAIEI